jgi:uncharacterized membrane protein
MSDDYELKPHDPVEATRNPPPATPADSAPPNSSSAKPAPTQEEKSEADLGNHRAMAILAYIPVFVVVPLIFGQQSRFVRYHTNQGFLLFSLEALRWGVMSVLYTGLPLLFQSHPMLSLFGFINGVISFLFLALAIVGILHVMSGNCEELPGIGKYRVIEIDPAE